METTLEQLEQRKNERLREWTLKNQKQINRDKTCELVRKAFRILRKDGLDCHFRYDYDKFDTHNADVSVDAKIWKAFRHCDDQDVAWVSFSMDDGTSAKVVSVFMDLGIHIKWNGQEGRCIEIQGQAPPGNLSLMR